VSSPSNENQDSVKISLKEPTLEIDNHLPLSKRRRQEADVLDAVFKFETDRELNVTSSLIKASSLATFYLTSKDQNDNGNADIPLISSQEGLSNMLFFFSDDDEINVVTTSDEDKKDSDTITTSKINDEYIFNVISSSKYSGLLKHDNYSEMNEDLLDICNTDWTTKPSLRLACAQLMAGALLVEGKQIIIINCIEVYARLPTLDRHFERFSSSTNPDSSIPTISNKYKGLNVTILNNHNSRKLTIGTFVFNGLVTSSLRLDMDAEPELGASTLNFTPSANTKVYIAHSSITSAKIIMEKDNNYFNRYDHMSQLRQLRSQFASISTYLASRCSSVYTNNITCRPYTIFTVADSEGNTMTLDVKIGSQIFQQVAIEMMFGKGCISKTKLKSIHTDKNTQVNNLLKNIIDLFDKEETM
jgi:hypothetical protein